MAREQQAAFDVGPRAGAGAGDEEEVGETALEDAPPKGSDPASAVGPRVEVARQLSATQAARPIWASPRFADTGAQRLATLSDRGLRSAAAGGYETSRRAASLPAHTHAATMGWEFVFGGNDGDAPRHCSTVPLRGRNLPHRPRKRVRGFTRGEQERGRDGMADSVARSGHRPRMRGVSEPASR